MNPSHFTDYNEQAKHFAQLPEYSIHCGTDFLAVRDVPNILKQYQPLHRILDLGCGSGLATRYLKKHFANVSILGADINQTMLQQALLADPQGLYFHLQETAQGVYYPFLANFFDVIVCSFVLHEMKSVEELEKFISHIATMLRPGGVFLAWDVFKNLFQGRWVNIEPLSPTNGLIEERQQFKLRISPVNAEVTGTYWHPETISTTAQANNLQTIAINFPLAEPGEVEWRDETNIAPYYVLQAVKKA